MFTRPRALRWLLAAAVTVTGPAAVAGFAPAAPARAATYVYLTFDDGPSTPTPPRSWTS